MHLFATITSEKQFRKSCGGDLIERVAKICDKRGGYNHLEYFRGKRNIIMECCQNACSDVQLYLYCAGQTETYHNDVDVDMCDNM